VDIGHRFHDFDYRHGASGCADETLFYPVFVL
jgi:hypothetical protein